MAQIKPTKAAKCEGESSVDESSEEEEEGRKNSLRLLSAKINPNKMIEDQIDG